MFAQNPLYVAYESLLKRLHRLIAEGKEDSEEANAVREVMQSPFRQLSQGEQERLNNLSGDLYQLQDDEVFEPMDDPAKRTEQYLRDALNAAYVHKNWETLLSLLRKGPTYLAAHQIAFLRANAFINLGHIDTALLFMQYASEKVPQNAFYKADVLRLLCDLERTEEAIAQAYYCLSDTNSAPNALILSALVLYGSTQHQAAEDTKPVYKLVVAALERATNKIVASDVLPRELIADSYVLLGYAHDALDQHFLALSAYTNALTWNQTNTTAREALDLLSQRSRDTVAYAANSLGWRKPPSNHFGPVPKLHDRTTGERFSQLAFAG